ncbi:MAG: murein biosynthesis integral membrane protein MurJ [Phycisphaerales bacterium JB040]
MAERTPVSTDDSLASGTRTLSLVTLASRVTGLARDLVTARIFADTAVGSAFAAALLVPNTFRRLFGEGALSAAFLPPYTRLADDDEANATNEAGPYARVVLRWLLLLTAAITVALELALGALLLAFPGSPERSLSLRLMMIALPFMPLICVAAILGGMLQAHKKFAVWAAAPILLNACLLAAALPYFLIQTTPQAWAYPITASTLVAGVAQIAWSLASLRRHVRWDAVTDAARERARAMRRTMLPALIGLGTLQLNTLADTLLAMYPIWFGPTILARPYPLDDTSNAVLFFSQRLYQFPLGVFGIAVATAAFPALARAAQHPERFADVLARGVRLSLFIALPASLGLLLVRTDLVTVLYSSPDGSSSGFSQDGVDRAAAVLLMYAGAVWAYSLNQLFTRAFYARGDTTTPMRVALATVALNLALNLVLIWPLREAGLALATAITALLQTLALALILRTRATHTRPHPVLAPVATVLAITACMGLAVLLAQRLLPSDTWTGTLLRLAAATGAGGLAYGLLAHLTRRPELRWLLARTTQERPDDG